MLLLKRMCKRGLKLSPNERLKRYIKNKNALGYKRVSFFVDKKVWKYFIKNAKKNNMTINDYLKFLLDFN